MASDDRFTYLHVHADCASNGAQKRMRYVPSCYASDIVIKGGHKLVGWPADVPFTDLSNVRGGVKTLHELHRRWYLPEGHPDKLRFEPASREDRANAARDPASVHPTPQHLPQLVERAAARAARAFPVEVDAYRPDNMEHVGCQLTSMVPEPKEQRAQRVDTGKRRARKSDTSTKVRKRRQQKGITSKRFVLPGSNGRGSSGGGKRTSKRKQVDDYALDDPITEFRLTAF
ncbi:uncharacterized protein TRAVEDRAFT_47983 [Trametes versicolor FP-101664 SS1]|uniref:uncharacterized protein n=1 Tax=Trametes versicolor (strain FP-101664) TaxID=717944 RepID=UPI0004621478|nr:uncharacterized protein TRAVEDRAFT_47983 [Trametes versicolor FP-101664 SS1]EIW58841.1 hypothetical protein TRAVEDRAFT_47983 [Trametes versicolor FP-101664 SS1]